MSSDPSQTVSIPASTEVGIIRDNSKQAAALIYGGDAQQYYCSMPSDFPDREAILMKCSFTPDAKIADNVNKVLSVRHIYGTRVMLENPVTHEVDEVVRTVLITEDGQTWACTSKGMAKSVAMLMGSRGTPDTWDGPVKVMIVGVAAKVGKMLCLRVLPDDKPKRAKV